MLRVITLANSEYLDRTGQNLHRLLRIRQFYTRHYNCSKIGQVW